MTTLEYLEKVDDTLTHWEDYFHGQEGIYVTEARANLDMVRKQLLIQSVSNCNDAIPYDSLSDIEFGQLHKPKLRYNNTYKKHK